MYWGAFVGWLVAFQAMAGEIIVRSPKKWANKPADFYVVFLKIDLDFFELPL